MSDDETFDVDQALEDATRSILLADVAFEDLNRMCDTYNTLMDWMETSDTTSFESTIKPMLSLVMAGTEIQIGDVSVESAIDIIKAIGKAIIDTIRKLFEMLLSAISNFDIVSTWLLRNIKLLERKRLTSRGKVPKEPNVTLKTNHRFLRVGRFFADQPVKLIIELKRLDKLIQLVNNEYAPALSKGASSLKSRGAKKTGDELKKAILDSVEDIGFNRMANHLQMVDVEKDRWGRSNVKATPPMIGGRSLFFFQGDLSDKGVSALRVHGFMFADTFRNPFPVAAEREFVTLTTGDLSDIPTVLTNIVMAISKGGSGRVSAALKQVDTSIEQYVTERMNDVQMTEADMRLLRTTANAFTSWSKNVAAPLYGTSLSVVRAVLAYAQASTKTYH